MANLEGKKGLVFGVANKNSIAWGIAQALHAAGADVGFSYGAEILKKRVEPLAASIGVEFVEECDVTNPEAVGALFAKAADHYGTLDFLVHSIAFAPREALGGRFVETTADQFKLALEVSSYSLVTLAREALPLMPDGGAIVTMTAYGSDKVFPSYNVMGVAKAALEATMRYLAADLGRDGIRVNAISASPIRTLSSAVISGFRRGLRYTELVAPVGNAEQDDVGDVAAFLLSDAASKITGQTIFVDGGYSIMAAPPADIEID